MTTKILVPTGVRLTIQRRGTVCKVSYTETMDPRAARVPKRLVVKALLASVEMLNRMFAATPEMRGMRVRRTGPLSVRVSGTCHTETAGKMFKAEFSLWAGDDMTDLHRLANEMMPASAITRSKAARTLNGPGISTHDHAPPSMRLIPVKPPVKS